MNHLGVLGSVVRIDLLGDGEQVLDVESPDLWTAQREGWGGQGIVNGLIDCVEEKIEMVRS
jgi:hypothetical protein